MSDPTSLPAWKALSAHHADISSLHMRDLFAQNPHRFEQLSIQFGDMLLDYSKNRITSKTFDLLLQLAQESNVTQWRDKMFAGEKINTTENRAVLHTALRNRSNKPIMVDGKDVMPQINHVLARLRHFSDRVRSGDWKGFSGKPITDIVNIGIGGSDLGPYTVAHALTPYAHERLKIHFISNVDGTHLAEKIKHLNPATVLFIIASKTFSTQETMTNALTARQWFLDLAGNEKQHVAKHFVAVSCHLEAVKKFGIDPENMFEIWDWVGGRYSLWSAIGLSIILRVGMDNFIHLLEGAHAMDEHFRKAPLKENIPVILALLGVWYNNFFNAGSHAILPYDYLLKHLPDHLKQVDMESNGKSVDREGQKVDYATGQILWGAEGINGQHAFYQLIHQGTRLIPTDFIASAQSHGTLSQHHNIVLANFLAQTEALMCGRSKSETQDMLKKAGLPDKQMQKQLSHMIFEGNNPSNSILIKKLTPYTLGSLLAMYEHKTFVQGIIWNLNSYDQWGVELGKQMTHHILEEIKQQTFNIKHNSSTIGLLHAYQKMVDKTA